MDIYISKREQYSQEGVNFPLAREQHPLVLMSTFGNKSVKSSSLNIQIIDVTITTTTRGLLSVIKPVHTQGLQVTVHCLQRAQ